MQAKNEKLTAHNLVEICSEIAVDVSGIHMIQRNVRCFCDCGLLTAKIMKLLEATCLCVPQR